MNRLSRADYVVVLIAAFGWGIMLAALAYIAVAVVEKLT